MTEQTEMGRVWQTDEWEEYGRRMNGKEFFRRFIENNIQYIQDNRKQRHKEHSDKNNEERERNTWQP